MLQLAPFPDAEKIVMAMLADIAPTVTATPAQITVATIRVQRVGGGDDFFTDYPRMEVCVFYPLTHTGDTDIDSAWVMSSQCQQTVLASRNTTVAGALVDNATTVTPAQQMPWDNPNIRRIAATYQLAFRRPHA